MSARILHQPPAKIQRKAPASYSLDNLRRFERNKKGAQGSSQVCISIEMDEIERLTVIAQRSRHRQARSADGGKKPADKSNNGGENYALF